MLTYEVNAGMSSEVQRGGEELYRVEFRAPVAGVDGQVFEDVVIRVDNVTRQDAEDMRLRVAADPDGMQTFCRRCPSGTIPAPHEHDSLPEERGWRHRDITNFRLMPMREAA